MDQSQAEARALASLHQGLHGLEDGLAVVPGSAMRRPYGWVLFVQSRRFVEAGDEDAMLVAMGPVVVLDDGAVHILGSARPSQEELHAFEAEHHLGGPVPTDGTGHRPPVWIGEQQGDRLPILALTSDGIVSALLRPAELDDLLHHGPVVLDRVRSTTIPMADIARIRSDGDTGLRVERRGDVDVAVRFATQPEREAAFDGLHRVLAPQAPIEQLRRPVRQFAQLAGFAVLFLALGLGLPWMVERGLIDRTQWLVATVFNAVGPMGFRALGVVLAAGCLLGLVARVVNNPARAGYRVRR